MLLILLYNVMSSVRVNVNKVTAIKYVSVLPLYYLLAIQMQRIHWHRFGMKHVIRSRVIQPALNSI